MQENRNEKVRGNHDPRITRTAWQQGNSAGSGGLGHFAVILLLCAAAFAIKSPDSLSNPQFWAEDGPVFFAQQQGHSLPQLFKAYAGYLHFIPRTVAWIGTWFSLSRVPMVFNALAWASASACTAYFLFRISRYRLGMVGFAAIFLSPTNGEIFGTITNVQWFAQLALVVACVVPTRPGKALTECGAAVLVFALALTGPFSALLLVIHVALLSLQKALPHARLDLPTPWSGSKRWTLTAMWAGGAIQTLFIATGGGSGPGEHSIDLVKDAMGTFAQIHLFGSQIFPSTLFIVATVAIGAWVAISRHESRSLIIVMTLLALIEIVSASGKQTAAGAAVGFSERYYFLFKVVFWLMTFEMTRAAASRYGQHLLSMFVAAFLLVVLVNPGKLARKPLEDTHWRQRVKLIAPGSSAIVPINPRPWAVTVEKES